LFSDQKISGIFLSIKRDFASFFSYFTSFKAKVILNSRSNKRALNMTMKSIRYNGYEMACQCSCST
ncbi:hypothetical protein OPU38_14960, partial [Acinetobacter baumannii]|nr:hypothetical protein [Acinetobacter baumannii]